jgi:hypothetical protein
MLRRLELVTGRLRSVLRRRMFRPGQRRDLPRDTYSFGLLRRHHAALLRDAHYLLSASQASICRDLLMFPAQLHRRK